MANGFTNPFGPINNAFTRYQQTLSQIPQIKGQRLQNQAEQIEIQNALVEQAQQKQFQGAMQKYRQGVGQAQQQFRQRKNQLQGAARAPSSVGMPRQQAQQQMQQMGQIPQYAPAAAEIEILKQQGRLGEAREVFSEYVNQFKDLVDVSPERAEQFWQQNFGESVKVRGSDKIGTVVESDQGLFRLGPGGKLEPLTAGGQQLQQPDSEGRSAKEREIQRYLDEDIVQDRSEAIKLAEGLYRLKEGPFGVELWDLSTGQRIRRSSGPAQGQEGEGQQTTRRGQGRRDRPFLSLEEARAGVGPISGIKQTINNVIGPFTPGQPFEETERAKNKLAMFSQMIKPHLMVSSRGAIYEQQNIENMLPSGSDFLKDPDSAKTKLQNLYGVITATIRRKTQLMEQEEMTPEQMQQFNQDINNLQTALSYLPDEEILFGDESQQMTRQLQNMSIPEIKQINTKELTPEQRDLLEQRVDELLQQQNQ